ncbi:MAG: ferritin-like domain-containing protein [Linnemannia elongata]|nr:MAG: ferritin-like domain-containing protein [Linnemannia elongata]
MRFSFVAIASAIAATSMVLAAPLRHLAKRDKTSDIGILNYALTLEHLESAFYAEGLHKFGPDAFAAYHLDDKIRERFVHIGEHESTHVTVLTSVIEALGGKPVPKCTYKFPLDNLETFIAVSRALETTGVSAYTGAAAGITSEDLLTAAATIVTVEARQSSFLNELVGENGAPYSFDTPLTPREIVTMATNFIESCPYDLGIEPFTQLKASIKGDKVETSYDGEVEGRQEWCQFLYNNKMVVSRREECKLPPTVNGYVYVVITDTATPLTLKDEDRILAGPALLFRGDH